MRRLCEMATPARRHTTNSKSATPLNSLIRILCHRLSPLRGMRQQLAQTIDHFFEGESGGSRAGREFAGHLVELTFALGGFLFGLLVADECSGALVGFEHASEFELAVGAHHGVGIDRQIDGELAHGGKLVAGGEGTGGNATADLIDQLAVDRDAAVQVERELKPRREWFPLPCVSVYYSISTICQEKRSART